MIYTFVKRRFRSLSVFMIAMLVIEFLDEFAYGTREAAWPLIREDLNLNYAQIGMLIGLPAFIALFIEITFGILSNMGYRRYLILGGGVVFAGALFFVGTSTAFIPLLIAEIISAPASGAFVGLAQAALMDSDTQRHEQNMARWTLAGSVGVLVAPIALGAAVWIGFGWRGLFIFIGVLSLIMVIFLLRLRFPAVRHDEDGNEAKIGFRDSIKDAMSAARDFSILRWYILFIFSDLMLDVLHGFLALYFVDVAGVEPAVGGLAILVWTGVGLVGDIALIPLLERVRGLTYLRLSAAVTFFLYPAFLLIPNVPIKLVLLGLLGMSNAGWYSILAAQAYTALIGRSGTEMVLGTISSAFVGVLPLGIGLLAEQIGLSGAMWVCLLGPIAMFVGIPRGKNLQA
jgi:FSR family fosmidomycin resistance protein-like MFS transporter